jgi:hypothetical protein
VLAADIGGFSIPRMLGVEGRVQGRRTRPAGPGSLPWRSPLDRAGSRSCRWAPSKGRARTRPSCGRGGVSIDRSSPGHRVRAGLRRAADAHDELDWL